MTKQFKKWSSNTAVTVSWLLLAVFFRSADAQVLSSASVSTSGTTTLIYGTTYYGQSYVSTNSVKNISDKFGTPDALLKNFIKPMTAGQSMSTLDSALTFTAQLFCPSSKQFMTLAVLPSSTGDYQALQVQEDLDFDQTMEYTFNIPTGTQVSGVCLNGYISCTPGTWTGCNYYKWTADTSGKVGVTWVTQEQLGGCFCINNNCGSNIAINDSSIILQTLGGGAIAAIQGSNAHIAVTSATMDPISITYYSQDTKNCNIGSAAAGLNDQSKYYPNKDMSADANSQVTIDLNDNNSLYSKLLTSQAMVTSLSDYKTCEVARTLNVNTISTDPTYTWEPFLDLSIGVYMGRDSNNYILITNLIATNHDGVYNVTETPNQGAGIFSCDSFGYGGDRVYDYQRINGYVAYYQQLYGVQVTDITVYSNGNYWMATTCDGKRCTCNESHVNDYLVYRKSLPICPSGYTYVEASNKCYIENDFLSISDGCATYSQDSTCQKKEEIVDGVYVFKSYATTGLQPLQTCKSVPGVLATYTECEPWWDKHITYRCAPTAYDYSDPLKRNANIESTVTMDSNGIHYTDAIKDGTTGVWSYPTGTIPYSPMQDGTTTSCEYACKTKKTVTDTSASGTNTKAATATSTTKTVIFVKACTVDGCPLDASAGETLVQDCTCLNSFTQGASSLDIVGEAANDMVCTTGMTAN